MNGRYFGGKSIQAYIFDGTEKFQSKRQLYEESDDDEEQKRLDNYAQWLESQQEK